MGFYDSLREEKTEIGVPSRNPQTTTLFRLDDSPKEEKTESYARMVLCLLFQGFNDSKTEEKIERTRDVACALGLSARFDDSREEEKTKTGKSTEKPTSYQPIQ